MNTAIKIEGLGKKYIIGHQRQENYIALRDVLMHKLRGIKQRITHPLSPNKEDIDIEEFWALSDINIEIKQGDRVGIIGRNGAGKSTLLKLISRITEPTTGRIRINGKVSSLLEVGTGFHPELTGRENIYLNGAILGMKRAEIKSKFDEIVSFAEIEKFLDTPVKRYSSGMYVRLAFAVAAHLEPEILIVDEVLAVGDANFQRKCLNKLEDTGKEGRTVLFVSHNIPAIQNLCTSAILLSNGKKIEQGNVDDVINTYISEGYSATTIKNLFEHPRQKKNFGEKARIAKLEFLDSNLNKNNNFRFGESFYVEVEYRVIKPISDFRIMVGINSTQDIRILSLLSPDQNGQTSLNNGETIKAKVKVDTCLLPGKYSVVLAIRSNSILHDQLLNIGTFTIDQAREERLINEAVLQFGLLHQKNTCWKIERTGITADD